jgi:hypothetical protein
VQRLALSVGDVFGGGIRSLDAAVVSAQQSFVGETGEIPTHGLDRDVESLGKRFDANGSARPNDLEDTQLSRIQGSGAGKFGQIGQLQRT